MAAFETREPLSKVVTFRATESEKRLLDEAAAEHRKDIGQIVREALELWFAKNQATTTRRRKGER